MGEGSDKRLSLISKGGKLGEGLPVSSVLEPWAPFLHHSRLPEEESPPARVTSFQGFGSGCAPEREWNLLFFFFLCYFLFFFKCVSIALTHLFAYVCLVEGNSERPGVKKSRR